MSIRNSIVVFVISMVLSFIGTFLGAPAHAGIGEAGAALLRMERQANLAIQTQAITIKGSLICELTETNLNSTGCDFKIRDIQSGNTFALETNNHSTHQALAIYRSGNRNAIVQGRLVGNSSIAVSTIQQGENL